MHNEDSEDDNLATFTLSGGRNAEYSITATQRQNFSKTTGALARWILPGGDHSRWGRDYRRLLLSWTANEPCRA